jgi:acyl carrier protein
MQIREQIVHIFMEVAGDQEKTLRPLSDDLILLESGLDSLCFAIIIARLEDELGRDPFSESDEAHFPSNFGGFVALYESVGV